MCACILPPCMFCGYSVPWNENYIKCSIKQLVAVQGMCSQVASYQLLVCLHAWTSAKVNIFDLIIPCILTHRRGARFKVSVTCLSSNGVSQGFNRVQRRQICRDGTGQTLNFYFEKFTVFIIRVVMTEQ
jgi:hypothetical protein